MLRVNGGCHVAKLRILQWRCRRAGTRATPCGFNQKAWAAAEAANHTKDEFINVVSHELQTPVSVVLGWASAIRRRQLRGDALEAGLDAIERNAQVQSRLVQDLLDRSRIASGRLRLEPQIISLNEVIRAAVEQMRHTFDRHHVQLTTRVRDGDYQMSADAVRLQRRDAGWATSIGNSARRAATFSGHRDR